MSKQILMDQTVTENMLLLRKILYSFISKRQSLSQVALDKSNMEMRCDLESLVSVSNVTRESFNPRLETFYNLRAKTSRYKEIYQNRRRYKNRSAGSLIHP